MNCSLESNKKVIYDLGSNNGDDIEYYLKKSDIVVAVEANPYLARLIEERYKEQIREGRLFVENCVITADGAEAEVPFYLHKFGHLISQFPKPIESELKNFDEVMLPSKSVLHIISKYGNPHYIKVNIEGYDQEILRSLFNNKIYPEYISAESHNIEVFSLLVSANKYKSFNLIDGHWVPFIYQNSTIETSKGLEEYSFPPHSAGPFGADIKAAWMTSECLFKLLAFEGLGWKDIHAAKNIPPSPTFDVSFSAYAKEHILKKLIPKALRPLFARLGILNKVARF